MLLADPLMLTQTDPPDVLLLYTLTLCSQSVLAPRTLNVTRPVPDVLRVMSMLYFEPTCVIEQVPPPSGLTVTVRLSSELQTLSSWASARSAGRATARTTRRGRWSCMFSLSLGAMEQEHQSDARGAGARDA